MTTVTTAPIAVGRLELEASTRRLVGPQGSVTLDASAYALLERLARKPGVVVRHGELMEAVWPDPDDEPDSSFTRLRQLVGRVRAVTATLGGGSSLIMSHPKIGYCLRACRTAGAIHA